MNEGKEKSPRAFALAFVKLMQPNGTTLRNEEHELYLYNVRGSLLGQSCNYDFTNFQILQLTKLLHLSSRLKKKLEVWTLPLLLSRLACCISQLMFFFCCAQIDIKKWNEDQFEYLKLNSQKNSNTSDSSKPLSVPGLQLAPKDTLNIATIFCSTKLTQHGQIISCIIILILKLHITLIKK